ncbi:TPA: DUF6056 family protein [Citrobacter koseri]
MDSLNAKKTLLWLSPLYLMILLISLNTPLHSDDYYMSLHNVFDINYYITRYVTWSGRLTADVLASLILSTKNHFIIAIINSFGLFLLTIIISYIGLIFSNAKHESTFYFSTYIIASILFIASPAIGQTAFWVVGTANYTWTNVFLLISISIGVVSILRGSSSNALAFISFITAFLGGCGNENMSVTFVFALLVMLVVAIKIKAPLRINISLMAGGILGALSLLVAPGNYVRLKHTQKTEWVTSGFGYKIQVWLHNILEVIITSKIALFILLFLMIISVFIIIKQKKSQKNFLFALFFILLAIAANVVMFASPQYPLRAMNGQFIMLVCAISILWNFIALNIDIKFKKIFYAISLSILAIGLFNYSIMLHVYSKTMAQNKIRELLISKNVNTHDSEVFIPNYVWRNLPNVGMKYDTWLSSISMGRYYNVGAIKYRTVDFDYSVITERTQEIAIGNKSNIIKGWVYKNSPFTSKHEIVIPNIKLKNNSNSIVYINNRKYKIRNSTDSSIDNITYTHLTVK